MALRNAFELVATESTLADVLTIFTDVWNDALNRLNVRDDYDAQESLDDQSGANDVLTFSFSSEVVMVVVVSQGDNLVSRATADASETPASNKGVPCFHQAPTYIPCRTSTVKVYAPSGTAISVVGLRRT